MQLWWSCHVSSSKKRKQNEIFFTKKMLFFLHHLLWTQKRHVSQPCWNIFLLGLEKTQIEISFETVLPSKRSSGKVDCKSDKPAIFVSKILIGKYILVTEKVFFCMNNLLWTYQIHESEIFRDKFVKVFVAQSPDFIIFASLSELNFFFN